MIVYGNMLKAVVTGKDSYQADIEPAPYNPIKFNQAK